jgi:hypothetical protein
MRKKSVGRSPLETANRRLTAMVKEQTVTPFGGRTHFGVVCQVTDESDFIHASSILSALGGSLRFLTRYEIAENRLVVLKLRSSSLGNSGAHVNDIKT